MEMILPEKAKLLEELKSGGFTVPDFMYVPAEDFENENFGPLRQFFADCCDLFKVIARSAHPRESFFKGGTFDSLETYADVAGIIYARNRIIKSARNAKQLSIARQQRFSNAPEIDPDEMGIIIMPYIEGVSVMAKMIGDEWEFGYTRDRAEKITSEPYITHTPHDRNLYELSEMIQGYLDFRCEIEFIVAEEGDIYVVQAKDISHIDIVASRRQANSIRLDGVRRIRRRRNYRERPIYVMNNRALYMEIISRCEDIVLDSSPMALNDILALIRDYEADMEAFALRHERFGVLGLSVQVPTQLYQIANHYLDNAPEMQKQLSGALRDNLYKIDYFLGEADTLISKDRIRMKLCTHDAYGIDTLRNPIWSVYWHVDRHEQVVKQLEQIGFQSGDTVCIEIGKEDRPTIYRL
ncbi:hypothetical protein DENIS_3338 [Desulfonema ishimotonii]|uniref:Uncharacterized protein n=1 Tax=Desulfonema ishimotonii TaxID=45657 RepID=A0A401FZK0_9BACT|nr:hypothetical protein [Desulfonema ishimotonii]GBC62366.1 hypothetical protein DENIS_3338 [Desulfonema ishimotonii]